MWRDAWIYIVASLLGGAGAATLFAYLHPSYEEADRRLLSQVGPTRIHGAAALGSGTRREVSQAPFADAISGHRHRPSPCGRAGSPVVIKHMNAQ
jgi:hypothetical protein